MENGNIIEHLSEEKKEQLRKDYENDKKSHRLMILKIILKNLGKFEIIESMAQKPLLRTSVSYKQLKLPKGYSIYMWDKDEYHDSASGYILYNDKIIASIWTKLSLNYTTMEATVILDELVKLNEGHVTYKKNNKNFIIDSDLPLSEIKFPKGFKYKIIYFPAEGKNDIQCMITSSDYKNIPGVLNCYLRSEKDLIEYNKRKEENKKKEKEDEEKKKIIETEKKSLEEEKRKKWHEMKQKRIKGRYDDYIKFLIENGANKEIIELKAIQDIIYNIITNGDPRVIMDGRSPIAYQKPNSDGTFDIGGRMNGPTVSVWYKMSYCNDGDDNHYIVLKIQHSDEETMEIIDKNGNIVNNFQKGK